MIPETIRLLALPPAQAAAPAPRLVNARYYRALKPLRHQFSGEWVPPGTLLDLDDPTWAHLCTGQRRGVLYLLLADAIEGV